MKYLYPFILLLYFNSKAQTNRQHKLIYFNEEFRQCSKEDASYAGTTISRGNETDVIIYHPNGKKALTGTYADKDLLTKNGTFNWFDTNGIRIAAMIYKDDMADGMYLVWYSNKQLRDSGSLVNGTPDGIWKSWYPNGQLKVRCEYSAKKLKVFKKEANNDKIFRDVDNLLKPTNLLTICDAEKPSVTSTHIFYPFYFQFEENNGSFAIAALSTDEPEKNITNTDNDNILSTVCIRYDILNPSVTMMDGEYDYYNSNGQQMVSGNFKNGMKKGLWQIWSKDGKRKQMGIYERNHETGEWKYYNAEGELTRIKKFAKDGTLNQQFELK